MTKQDTKQEERPHNKTPNPHRITASDMATSMYAAKDDNKTSREENRVVAYTIVGQEDERVDRHGDYNEDGYPRLFDLRKEVDGPVTPASERSNAYAKQLVSANGQLRYYIKTGAHGKFYDPLGLYSEGRHQKKALGINEWSYKEVNRKAFYMYLDFLTTKNKKHLVQAEREAV